jgi:hypothetical protein
VAARSKAQFTCRAACWSSVPTPKAHTTIPLLRRRRPSFSMAHQAGARHLPEKRCKSLATSRSTMRAPSRIWRKRVWRQSQLRSSATTIIPARCKSEFCQMMFEEARAQTMISLGSLMSAAAASLTPTAFRPCLVMRSASGPLASSRRADQLFHGLACCSAFEVRRQLHSRCEAVDRMMSCVWVSFGIGISIRLARRRSASPPPQPHRGHAAGGAGSRTATRARNGRSTAPFAAECQSFLDVAGFGQTG